MIEIEIVKKKIKADVDTLVFVNVDYVSANLIIQSITNQIASGYCNAGRHEFYTNDGKYFSIAVHKDLIKRRKALEKMQKEEEEYKKEKKKLGGRINV